MALAVRTNKLPGEWAAELERDERAVMTVLGILDRQDRDSRQQQD